MRDSSEFMTSSHYIPIKAHNEREYHLCLLNRSKKSAIEIFSMPRAPIADVTLCTKPI